MAKQIRNWCLIAMLVMVGVTSAQQIPITPLADEILFAQFIGSSGDIYLMDSLGRNQRPVVVTPASESHPAWSPDRAQIIFQSNEKGNFDLWMIEFDTPETRVQLTNHIGDDTDPEWSPNGRNVVFTSNRDGIGLIYLMDSDGRNQQPLTGGRNSTGGTDSLPTWSPDGEKIAFASRSGDNQYLYLIDKNGNNLERLSSEGAFIDTDPAWSPDGKFLAFSSNRDGDFEIYVMNLETRESLRVTNNDQFSDTAPHYSADGKMLAFVTNRDGISEIYTISTLGTAEQRLTITPSGSSTNFPTWSPPQIFVKGYTVTEESVERILSQETVDLPNCGGTSTLTSIPSYVRSIEKTVVLLTASQETTCKTTTMQYEIGSSMGFSSALLNLAVSPRVESRVQNELCNLIETGLYVREGETILQSRELVLSASSRTSVSYDIQWVLVSQVGRIELLRGDKTFFVDFSLPDSLRGIVTASRNNGCTP